MSQQASTNTYVTTVPASEGVTINTSNCSSSFPSTTLPPASVSNSASTQSVSCTGESIRLPLNVTVKEEDDISFMVLSDSPDFSDSGTYGNNDSSDTFKQAQSVNSETLPLSQNSWDQENAHTARKMKGHVKLFQVTSIVIY